MLTQEDCDKFNAQLKGTMGEVLSITVLPSDKDEILASMPISQATCQYRGILHGGASLALAETIAGIGSIHLAKDNDIVCGTHVSGIHVSMSGKSGFVYAHATLLHAGQTAHHWNIDITTEDGRLLSTERVTNRILKRE